MGGERLAVADIILQLRSALEPVMEGFGWWYVQYVSRVRQRYFLAREID